MTSERWLSAGEWAVIVAMLAMDIAFAWATGIPVIHWQKQAAALAIVIAGWPAIALLSHVTGLAKGATFVAEIPGKTLTYILVASVLEYYLATSPLPLHDHLLNGIDRALGFDWIAMCNWVAPHTAIHAALSFAYFNLSNEAGLVLLAIVLFYPRRARRFTTALILSSVLTIPFLWMFPVSGPFIALTGLPDYCISDAVIAPHHYMMMRTHGFDAVDIETLSGIVAFPSYHATGALLLTYLLRGIPIVFPAAVAFNALMIAATPLIGGHYLTDVIAGFAVAAATIYLLQRLESRDASERAPLWPTPAETSSAESTAAH
jgi:membrane-associated phospholipid phosphatase